jgi:DNA-binding NarL/FixJ family response regulator
MTMTLPGQLPEDLIERADALFEGVTLLEQEIVRMLTTGAMQSDIALALNCHVSSIKSAIDRVRTKKTIASTNVLIYLCGLHDARAHARALREDTVHVIVSRGPEVHRFEV